MQNLNPAISKVDNSVIIPKFLTFLTQIKVFHWQTTSYAKHIASDTLHTEMSVLVDTFIETLQGKPNVGRLRVNFNGGLKVQNIDQFDITTYLTEFKYFLMDELETILESSKMRNDDLKNIRDEMLSLINKTLYLFTLQ